MADHVCPWWFCYTFDNPLRRLVHKPEAMLAAWVGPGMTALDLGCGMGYFTLGLARLVGGSGRVVAVDLQEKMLAGLKRRMDRAGLPGVVEPRRCQPDDLGLADLSSLVDFALVFWMLHEVPGKESFLHQVRQALNPRGRLLVSEPRFHVSLDAFQEELDLAQGCGWQLLERPAIWGSHSALLGPAQAAAQSAAA